MEKNNCFLSIVIPFHNEKESLEILVPSLLDVLMSYDFEYEIIFVDDCSSDESRSVIEVVVKNNPQIKLIVLEKQGGQTGCYRRAFEAAKGKYILRMDADLQDDPKDLWKFVEKMGEGADLIVGLREARKHSRLLRFASLVYDAIILLLFNSPLHSNSGSYVCFRADLVKDIPWHKNDHRYLPLIAMKRGAKNIREVLVRHQTRLYGQSKYKAIRKIIFGVPEVFLFLIRYSQGIYNKKL